MKTRSYFINLVNQIIEESKNFKIDGETGRPYAFMMKNQLSTHLKEYSKEWQLAAAMLYNYSIKGVVEYTPFQMNMFPINKTWGNIDAILREVDLQDIVLALGHRCYHSGETKWQVLVEVPDILRGEIKFSYAGHGHIKIDNPQILEEWGIVFPEPTGSFTIPVVEFKNYMSAGFTETMNFNSITELGWWSSDFSGYGSLVYDPFNTEITEDWVYNNVRQIGYMANDVLKQREANDSTWQSYTKTMFLNKVLQFFKENNLGVQIADGSYSGRSLGMKRGAENSRKIFPKKVEDFETFMGLGTFLQHWLEKEPVS